MDKVINKKITAIVLAVILVLGTITIFNIYAEDELTQFNGPSTAEETEKIIENPGGYGSLFEKDGVADIYIELSEEDWKSMLDDPMAEEYKSATVKVDGVTLENVGFRTKGNLTLRSVAKDDSERYSFKIKLDEYEKGQNLLGLDEFVVNNMYSDPSYMREYLSYEALREIGADVPFTSFANIYINGELYGFYLMVEAIDDSFLQRNFGDDNGNLYKQDQGSPLQYVEGSDYDKSELKSGDDETKTDLKNFIKVLNEMPEGEKGDLERVLDVDSALRYIATNTVLGNYDSYNGNKSHNYYLYGQDGKFTVIPWDYNMSMAGFGGRGQTTIPIDEPVMGENIEDLPLIKNLLAVEEYKEKYYEYINELLDYLENFEERVAELSSIIRPYIESDPTKFITMEEFEANITYSETNTTENQIMPQQPQTEADTTTSALQNEGPKQPPQDMPEGFDPRNRPQPPEGGMGKNMKGGPGGMEMMKNSTSIINFVRDRMENIKQQLAGELPTTGNTTMGGRNNRNN